MCECAQRSAEGDVGKEQQKDWWNMNKEEREQLRGSEEDTLKR